MTAWVYRRPGMIPRTSFPHTYKDLAYGVFARHGHEYDPYNYEGGTAYTEADYQRVPIGDPITTELVARLPFALAKRLDAVPGLSPEDKQNIIRNFQEIENVRPCRRSLNGSSIRCSRTGL